MATNLEQNEVDLSFLDSILQPQKEEKIDPNEDKFIIHSKQIDTHTIKRTRVKLTPAVCDICGFDLLKLAYAQNKVATTVYKELIPEVQAIFKQALVKHKQLAHSAADNLIVSASQLRHTKKWLSGRDV